MKGGKNALKVKWSITNDNGATISGYVLELKQKEENKFNVIYEGSENNYNVLFIPYIFLFILLFIV